MGKHEWEELEGLEGADALWADEEYADGLGVLDESERSIFEGIPTQVVHPMQAVIRTVAQRLAGGVVAGAIAWFGLDLGAHVDAITAGFVFVISVTVTGFTTWFMARPGVNKFIREYLPFLATGVEREAPNGDSL